jgi:ribose transport system permease protein
MDDVMTRSSVDTPTTTDKESRGFLDRLRGGPSWGAFWLRYGMVWVLIALALLANILFSGFFAPENLNNMVGQVAATGIVSVGMTYAIISGGFDLSVGAVFAGASVVYAALSNHVPLLWAFVLTALVGVVAGAINGIVVTKLKVNAFIATLATSSLFAGATVLFWQGSPVSSTAAGFTTLGQGQWGGVWISIFMLVAFVAVLGVVLAKTPYGRSVYAVGGNLEAARLAGMRIDLIRISTYALTAMCAAVGGMIVASQTGIGQSNVGATVTLDSIAIVIIGGTSLMGGEGAMWRTVVGVLMWGTIGNVFASLALDTSSQLLLQGGILLVAVALDSLSRRIRR